MKNGSVEYGKAFVETVFAGYGVPVYEWRRYTAMLHIEGRLDPCTFQRPLLEACEDPRTAAEVREHIRLFLDECRVPVLT
jgi:hypothetical protein